MLENFFKSGILTHNMCSEYIENYNIGPGTTTDQMQKAGNEHEERDYANDHFNFHYLRHCDPGNIDVTRIQTGFYQAR